MEIKAGKYYKTRDGERAYCTAVELDSPERWKVSSYPVHLVKETSIIATTVDGFCYANGHHSGDDIVSEWVKHIETRTFKSPKQLAKALLKKEQWSTKSIYTCRFDNGFYSGSGPMKYSWKYADGKTLWTREK